MCAFGEKDKQDLLIRDKKTYSYSNCKSNLGSSYEIPEGKDSDWFTGSSSFKIIEIEVYTVKLS